VKCIAFQTSSGCVSDFLQRYLGMNEDITWVDIKAELAREENVQMFAERMLTLAEEAY
jgi:hypothetical protein